MFSIFRRYTAPFARSGDRPTWSTPAPQLDITDGMLIRLNNKWYRVRLERYEPTE